eukprot:gb/GFBE01032520.1/.p1 GENE.gb/GFBE01032520.1/~~gb/GFBE01032520.1/.p1  ORF type:complete len:239 (+),score=54.33 gb/GFBE01032520.1/:1-717(+)
MWCCADSCGGQTQVEDVTASSKLRLQSALQDQEAALRQLEELESKAQKKAATDTDAFDTYDVKLDFSDTTKLGLTLDLVDPTLCFVKDLDPQGMIAIWNKKNPSDSQVKLWDRLFRVNGQMAASKDFVRRVQEAQANKTSVELTFQRPVEMLVPLDKKRCPLGMTLTPKERYVRVDEVLVSGGAVASYNAGVAPIRQLSSRCRIAAVDGKFECQGPRILDEVMTKDSLELKVFKWSDE